jgi:SAM-dependent methyltransferase
MIQTQTDWEDAYRRRETPWEKGHAHPALLDFVAENGPLSGEIFIPGCGTGQDLPALSTTQNHIVAIDFATRAIARAKSRPRVGNEEYFLADLFNLPPKFDHQFDWICEHTCFCAINPSRRSEYVSIVVRLLKPTGKMLAIFFINPDNEEGGPPYPVSRQELEQYFGPYFVVEREWVPQRTHPGREHRELMRILTRV